jgi:4-amino-4-deoxy-L-arabinose transferase-like glycosyltransferase
LLLLIVGGTFFRLDRLSLATMGHTEIYVPNIPLPDDYGSPNARLTLRRTVTGSMWEPHPPGWYVLMFGWTKIAGTGLFAIRLPSVVFGVLSIVLIFALGRLAEDMTTGFLGAAFMAFNGHQIYWSRIARPATLVCALGLLSCIFLLLSIRRQGSGRGYAWLYMLVAFAGLTSEHYFWMILAGQMTYCFVNMRDEQRVYRATLIGQLFVVALAAPLVTLAVFQGGVPYLTDDALGPARGLLEFGFLFEGPSQQTGPLLSSLKPWLAALGGGLLLAGLLAIGRPSRENALADWGGPGTLVFSVAACLACAGTLTFARILAGMAPGKAHLLTVTAILPAAALAAAWLLNRLAGRIAEVGRQVRRVPILSRLSGSLLAVMAIVPFALTAAVSKVTPLMASRHLLIFVPYILLVMVGGVLWLLGPMDRWLPRVGLVTFLVGATVVHSASIGYNLHRHQSPHDYHGLADQWKPQVQTSDVILVPDHFRTTPLFYYMKPSDYAFVGRNYSTEVRKRNPARIWVLRIAGPPRTPAMEEAVAGYEHSAEVRAENIGAELYVRSSPRREPR